MATGDDSKIHLPDDSDNPGPMRHTRTHSDAAGDTVHEEVVQVDDVPTLQEQLDTLITLQARTVWLLQQAYELDSSEITTDDV